LKKAGGLKKAGRLKKAGGLKKAGILMSNCLPRKENPCLRGLCSALPGWPAR